MIAKASNSSFSDCLHFFLIKIFHAVFLNFQNFKIQSLHNILVLCKQTKKILKKWKYIEKRVSRALQLNIYKTYTYKT